MLGLLMPLWGRSELSGRVLAYWSGPSFASLYRVAVVSPEDADIPDVPEGWTVVEHENVIQPKWQAGLDVMRGVCDAVMMMGSDDLMTPGLVHLLHDEALTHGMAHPTSLYYAHEATGRTFHAKYRTVFAGCTYSLDAVENAGWDIFTSGHHASLAPDVVSATKMRPVCPTARALPPCHEMGGAVVDIKGPGNVWSYDFQERRARNRLLPCPSMPALFGTHFPNFVLSPPNQGEGNGLQGRCD